MSLLIKGVANFLGLTDTPAANYEIGERRTRLTTVPIAFATELLVVRGQHIPANSSFWGKLKTATGNADTADISIALTRHTEISSPTPKWAAFPW